MSLAAMGLAGLTAPLVTALKTSGDALVSPWQMSTDGSYLYMGDTTSLDPFQPGAGPYLLRRVDISSGVVTTLYSQATNGVGGAAVIGSNIYWPNANSGPAGECQFFQANKDGSSASPTVLQTGWGTNDTLSMATDGATLFGADQYQGRVYSLPPTVGGTLTQLGPDSDSFGFPGERQLQIRQRGGILYISDPGRSSVGLPARVLSIPKSGGSFTTLHSGFPLTPGTGVLTSLDVADNGMIYLAESHANNIWKLPSTGGIPQLLMTDSDFPAFVQITGLVYLNGYLYLCDWNDAKPGAIWQVDLRPNLLSVQAEDADALNAPETGYTNSPTVQVVLGSVATGDTPTWVQIDEDPGFASPTTLSFATGGPYPYTFDSSADTTKTLHVRLANTFGLGAAASCSITLDTVPPQLTSLSPAPGQATTTAFLPIVFEARFSEEIHDFFPTDLGLATSTTPGTLWGIVGPGSSGPGPFTVAVSGATGPGVVTLSVQGAGIFDRAGNPATTGLTTSVTYVNAGLVDWETRE